MLSFGKSPCKDCDRRYPACHDKCQEYSVYRSKLDARNNVIRDAKEKRQLITGYQVRSYEKATGKKVGVR